MDRLQPDALGVYVVTSGTLVAGRTHLDVALAAVRGGADAVQVRAPELSDEELLPMAREVSRACAEASALCVVNDRVGVAAELGCGAHVGQDDDVGRARSTLGPGPVLGVSVSNPVEARAAEAAGGDYLGVTVWATPTKPEAVAVGLGGLRAVVGSSTLPVVGIGGITVRNAVEVLVAGAAGVAVVSAVGWAPDPEAATRELVEVVHGWRARTR
ncbi:MAG TPA: thiamine phosphate synthase [Actinomycetota bacterium]